MKRFAICFCGGVVFLAGLGVLEGMTASPAGQSPAAAGAQTPDPSLETLRAKAQERMALDRSLLSNDEFRDLESLYQSANRDLGSPGAKAKLKEVVRKYPRSNRAGCAVLYLAQMSTGSEREEYLKSAIASYGNSWYGDGVQVGPSLAPSWRSTTRTRSERKRHKGWRMSSGRSSQGPSIIRALG